MSREKGDTFPKMLKYNYEKYGDRRTAMRHKHLGIWQPYTWKDYYLNVKYLALGLLSLGFQSGDKLLIIGDNAPQWYYAELAAQANHGVAVGLCSDLSPSEIEYFARNCEARFAMVQDQEQVDKLLQIKEKLPKIERLIYWTYKGLSHYGDPLLLGYREVQHLGRQYEEQYPGRFERNVETGKGEDVCAIVYTSGTTGAFPKGTVHTYETMRASVEVHLSLNPWNERDNILPYWPPTWMAEQWFGIGGHLLSGCILNFAEAPETHSRDMRETQPSIVIYAARLWESQARAVQARILAADSIKRFTFRLLMPVGLQRANLELEKKKAGLFRKGLYLLADTILLEPIKASLGLSNARICYSTGEALSPEVLRFYHALHLPLQSLYGSTEAGLLSGAKNDDIRLETVGPVHQGTEVGVTDHGELIFRGPGIFLGYYNDREATARVFRNGWFHSRDSGFIEENGHLVFRDRLEDFVELASGDRLAPQLIESRLRFSPYIKDAWVLPGPRRDYTSAVIVIHYDNVRRWAGQRKVAYTTFADLSQKPEVCELVKQDIERINRTLPPGLRVKKYINLHKEFDPEEGELTRNRKLRRRFLEARYSELIDALYGNKTEVSMETLMRDQEGRTETLKTTLRIISC